MMKNKKCQWNPEHDSPLKITKCMKKYPILTTTSSPHHYASMQLASSAAPRPCNVILQHPSYQTNIQHSCNTRKGLNKIENHPPMRNKRTRIDISHIYRKHPVHPQNASSFQLGRSSMCGLIGVIFQHFSNHKKLTKSQSTLRKQVRILSEKISNHASHTQQENYSHTHNQLFSTPDTVPLQSLPNIVRIATPISSTVQLYLVRILGVRPEDHNVHGCNAHTERRQLVILLNLHVVLEC